MDKKLFVVCFGFVLLCFFVLFCFFKGGSYYVAQAILKHYVDQASLELSAVHLPLPHVLGLKVFTTVRDRQEVLNVTEKTLSKKVRSRPGIGGACL